MSVLYCGNYRIDCDRPVIMAIINITPDSFSGDGLSGTTIDDVLRKADAAIADGASILDVGGESTRPGAATVSVDEEISRVVPIVRALCRFDVPVSVDTTKAPVMMAAIEAGASMINDINAFRGAGAIDAVAGANVGVCVMHMQGEPGTMQSAPSYVSVVDEVELFLAERVNALVAAGISRQRVCVDPGFGFGKRIEHNLALLRRLDTFVEGGLPVLVGMSRKSMIGEITGKPVADRMVGSAVAAVMAVELGARIVRVHDVSATHDALRIWESVTEAPPAHA